MSINRRKTACKLFHFSGWLINESSSSEKLGLEQHYLLFNSKTVILGSFSTHKNSKRTGDERVQLQGIMGWWWKHLDMFKLKENRVKSNLSSLEEFINERKSPLGQPSNIFSSNV